MKKLALDFLFLLTVTLLLSTQNAFAHNYCMAIRGNGELAPAHWPAAARLVEELGMPKGVSGGSSASVSLYFLDSLGLNSLAKSNSPNIQNLRQAILLKGILPYTLQWLESEGALDIYQFVKSLNNETSDVGNLFKVLLKGSAYDSEMERKLLDSAELLNPELIKGLLNPSTFEFYKQQALEAVSVFGKFDAYGDKNLFVRPGLVDFKVFALRLGMIGDFLAGKIPMDQQRKMRGFLNACAQSSYRKLWEELPSACHQQFKVLVAEHITYARNRISETLTAPIGQSLSSIPSTSIVRKQAVTRYNQLLEKYALGVNADYSNFSLDFWHELRFGYWGRPSELKKIRKNLRKYVIEGDQKSAHFFSLGHATWFDILSTSPAEPGLANFQKIPSGTHRQSIRKALSSPYLQRWDQLTYRSDILSAGGWSDLHPTLILKALGCEQVVYINRKGGEGVFAQQVFIRLNGLQSVIPFWNVIETNNDKGWDVQNTKAELTPWNSLYNMGNPKSSYVRSVDEADAVYCTNWNAYDPFSGEALQMIEESYEAPVFLHNRSSNNLAVNPNHLGYSRSIAGCYLHR